MGAVSVIARTEVSSAVEVLYHTFSGTHVCVARVVEVTGQLVGCGRNVWARVRCSEIDATNHLPIARAVGLCVRGIERNKMCGRWEWRGDILRGDVEASE